MLITYMQAYSIGTMSISKISVMLAYYQLVTDVMETKMYRPSKKKIRLLMKVTYCYIAYACILIRLFLANRHIKGFKLCLLFSNGF